MSSLFDREISKNDHIFNTMISTFLETEPEDPEPEPEHELEQDSFEFEIENRPAKDLKCKLSQLSYIQSKYISKSNISYHAKLLANIEYVISCIPEADLQARRTIQAGFELKITFSYSESNFKLIKSLERYVNIVCGDIEIDKSNKLQLIVTIKFKEVLYYEILQDFVLICPESNSIQVQLEDCSEMSLEDFQFIVSTLPKSQSVHIVMKECHELSLPIFNYILTKEDFIDNKLRYSVEFFGIDDSLSLDCKFIEKNFYSNFSPRISLNLILKKEYAKLEFSNKKSSMNFLNLSKKRLSIRDERVKPNTKIKQISSTSYFKRTLIILLKFFLWTFILWNCFIIDIHKTGDNIYSEFPKLYCDMDGCNQEISKPIRNCNYFSHLFFVK